MNPRHYSQLYRELRAIDPRDYQRIIRMYEEQEAEIGRLDVLEHFELTAYYVDALFETGAYRKHQMMVDLVIHACIEHDIRALPGLAKDVFEYQLFRKAASAYRIQDYPTAAHVLRELLRIYPDRPLYTRFLGTILFRAQRDLLQFGRAACIFCTLLTALLVTLNLLVVSHFYPTYTATLYAISGEVFGVGLLCLLGSYAYAYFSARREARDFQRTQANKRQA